MAILKRIFPLILAISLILMTSIPVFADDYVIMGYIQNATIGRLDDVEIDKLTHLIYTDIHVTNSTNPALIYSGANITTCVTLGHADGAEVLVSLTSSGAGILSTIVNDPTDFATLIDNIHDLLDTYNLDGIDINWEPYEEGVSIPATNDLIDALYAELHSEGYIITLAGYASETIFNVGLTESAKLAYINIMAYDLGYPDHSTYSESITMLNAWAGAGYSKAKLTMGIPVYARDSNGDVAFYDDVQREIEPIDAANTATIASINGYYNSYVPPPTTVDGGVIWWNGIDLAEQKAQFIVDQDFAGIMFYDVGEDYLGEPDGSDYTKSLLRVMYNVFYPEEEEELLPSTIGTDILKNLLPIAIAFGVIIMCFKVGMNGSTPATIITSLFLGVVTFVVVRTILAVLFV